MTHDESFCVYLCDGVYVKPSIAQMMGLPVDCDTLIPHSVEEMDQPER